LLDGLLLLLGAVLHLHPLACRPPDMSEASCAIPHANCCTMSVFAMPEIAHA